MKMLNEMSCQRQIRRGEKSASGGKKIIISIITIAFFIGVVFAGGIHFGMPSAVKSQVKELDKKVKSDSRYTGPTGPTGTLMLKGSFRQSSASSLKGFDSSMSVNRVVLVTLRGFRIENINADNFSLDVGGQKGGPLGVIFISTSNQVAGCLQLVVNSTDTLNLLPLTKIKDGVREIDLQAISFSTDTYGNIAIPTYDPVSANGEIPFSDTEKKSVAKGTKILANILKHPDIDGNGVVDFLEGKYYTISFSYGVYAGSLPVVSGDGSYNAVVSSVCKLNGFGTVCYVNGLSRNNYPITFPLSYSWPHLSVSSTGWTSNTGGADGGTAIPTDGEYKADASNDGYGTLTFNVSGQADSVDSIIIPVPKFYISNGNLQKVTWEWKMRNDITGPSIDPTAFIEDFDIQASSVGARTYDSEGGGEGAATHPWAGVHLTGAEGEHIIGVPDLSWTEDCNNNIAFGYNDKFGNVVVVGFIK